MENIQVILHKQNEDGSRYDISNIVTNITWSGDTPRFYRTLTVDFMNKSEANKRLVTFGNGMLVQFLYGGKELFQGFIFNYSQDGNGGESWDCYDAGIYLYKNYETLLVSNETASSVISRLCKTYGVPVGSIVNTTHKIKKLAFNGSSLADIFTELLNETTASTSVKYNLYFKNGKLYLEARGNSEQVHTSFTELLSGSRSVSIEEVATKIKVVKGNIEESVSVANSSSSDGIKRYGVMQHVESVDDEMTQSEMQNRANQLLKDLCKQEDSVDIEVVGHPEITAGKRVNIKFGMLSKSDHNMYVTADSHTFTGSLHRMSLQLNNSISDKVGE